MAQSVEIMRDYPISEATRDPIFLLEVRVEHRLDDGNVVMCWAVDYGHGVWLTRKEAVEYAMRRDYHYGKEGKDWRVYCCCAEGQLADVLKQHTKKMEG